MCLSLALGRIQLSRESHKHLGGVAAQRVRMASLSLSHSGTADSPVSVGTGDGWETPEKIDTESPNR